MVSVAHGASVWACWCSVLLLRTGVYGVGKQPRGSSDSATLVDQLLEQIGIGKGNCKEIIELARASLKPVTQSLRDIAEIT